MLFYQVCRKLRAVSRAFRAIYQRTVKPIAGASHLEFLAVLLPRGALVAERLAAKPALKKRLTQVPVLKGNLWTIVDQAGPT